MNVQIVIDSTSDITPQMAKAMGNVHIMPLTVSFGNEHFQDGIDITPETFYTRLVHDSNVPTTTQPLPGYVMELVSHLSKETDQILILTLSQKLSGTYQSALYTKKTLESPGCRIEVLDTQLTTLGHGLRAVRASDMAKEGANLDQILEELRKPHNYLAGVMYFDTLKYLARGGRIGKAQSLLGAMLSFKPIITVQDGEVSPVTRVRSHQAGMDYLYNYAASRKNIRYLGVEHANTPEVAESLIDRLGNIFPKEKIIRSRIGPVIGTSIGPNAVCVVAWADA
ncbi:MAG: DegV family protein [Dehalococcoides mccartyi]|uniref:DegV family protein n=1 Tax=Dehalococcoides mccartyi TaxID=61435 RepID=UPI0030F64D08